MSHYGDLEKTSLSKLSSHHSVASKTSLSKYGSQNPTPIREAWLAVPSWKA
ncbi:hypothetical protein ACH5RR_021424, partial [Cinchona calisaya]